MYFIGSNKYIITKVKCWPVFKQDPIGAVYFLLEPFVWTGLLNMAPSFAGQ